MLINADLNQDVESESQNQYLFKQYTFTSEKLYHFQNQKQSNIQKYKQSRMKLQEERHPQTSSNYGYWFNSTEMKEYIAPKTLANQDFIAYIPVDLSQKYQKNQEKQRQRRGFSFQKTEKKAPFIQQSSSPGPAKYLLYTQVQNAKSLSNKKIGQSTKKISRFPEYKGNLIGVGVGDYNVELNLGKYKQCSMSLKQKAERTTYFDSAISAGLTVPGPGEYELRKITKSHSVCASKKLLYSSSAGNLKKKNKQNNRSREISPFSYNIERSPSTHCSAVLKQPYKQVNSKMKQKLQQWRKEKAKNINPAPGKYIKIEQWGVFKDNKFKSNCLNICSRPGALRIYN